LRQGLDHTAFAGPGSPVKDDADLASLAAYPGLQLDELDVELAQLFLVLLALQPAQSARARNGAPTVGGFNPPVMFHGQILEGLRSVSQRSAQRPTARAHDSGRSQHRNPEKPRGRSPTRASCVCNARQRFITDLSPRHSSVLGIKRLGCGTRSGTPYPARFRRDGADEEASP